MWPTSRRPWVSSRPASPITCLPGYNWANRHPPERRLVLGVFVCRLRKQVPCMHANCGEKGVRQRRYRKQNTDNDRGELHVVDLGQRQRRDRVRQHEQGFSQPGIHLPIQHNPVNGPQRRHPPIVCRRATTTFTMATRWTRRQAFAPPLLPHSLRRDAGLLLDSAIEVWFTESVAFLIFIARS